MNKQGKLDELNTKVNWSPIMGLFALLGLGAIPGCSGEPHDDEYYVGEWQAQIDTTSQGIRIKTQVGSVWRSQRFIRVISRIGSGQWGDHDVLGSIGGAVADTLAQRVYVIDPTLPAIRVYSLSGEHLFDFGRKGNGPGELIEPNSIDKLRDWKGIVVQDGSRRRLVLFASDGTLMREFQFPYYANERVVSASDGRAYVRQFYLRPGEMRVDNFVGINLVSGDTTSAAIPIRQGAVAEVRGVRRRTELPFGSKTIWAFGRNLSWVHGHSSRYEFTIQRRNEANITVVMPESPVPVKTGEAEWNIAFVNRYISEVEPGWEWANPPIPSTKPFFNRIVVDHSNRIWIVRPGPGVQVGGCTAGDKSSLEFSLAPCWYDTTLFDLFDENGEFLGRVTSGIKAPDTRILWSEGSWIVLAHSGVDGAPLVVIGRIGDY